MTWRMIPSLAQISKDVDGFINKGEELSEVKQILITGG